MKDIIWKVMMFKKSDYGMGRAKLAQDVVFQDESLEESQLRVAEIMARMQIEQEGKNVSSKHQL